MWAIAIVVIVVALVRTHRVDTTEVILFCVLVPSVILHEVAHGAVALVFGDDTAKRAGRLTLNPLRHVTVWGTIVIPVITVLAGLGWFGWAKPVPVTTSKLRSPRNAGVVVALAGPATNLALAAIFGAIFALYLSAGLRTGVSLLARIVFYAGFMNLWIACFNLVPIPPLDGSAVVERMLPSAWWPGYLRVRPYGMFLIFGALVVMSFTRVDVLQWFVNHLVTWWAGLVHA